MDPAQLHKFTELMAALSSQDNDVRRNAEVAYNATRNGDPNMFVYALISVTAGDSAPHIKQQGAVLLRQTMKAHRDDFVWPKLSEEAKTFVKTQLLHLLETERSVSNLHSICNVVGELGSYLNSSEKTEWPELLPKLFALVTSDDTRLKEAGLRVLIEVIGAVGSMLLKAPHKDAVVGVLSTTLAPTNTASVRVQAVLLYCRIALDLPSAQYKHIQPQTPNVLAVVRDLVQRDLEDGAQECLRSLADVADTEPMIFKPFVAEVVNTGLTIAANGKNLESATRAIALEVVCSFVEQKAKMVLKAYPAVVRETVRCCMQMMLELEDDDVKAWMGRFADADEEQEEEEVYDVGLTSLDRFAKVFGSELVLPVVFVTVGEFITQPKWQCKVAALMALNQVAEIVQEDAHADEIVKLLLANIQDPHPRVRYASIHAIGQVSTDCAPRAEDMWHADVIPALCRAMDDPVSRIGSHACSAFVNFGEECDLDNLMPHVDNLMSKLFPRMQQGQARQVRQESVTAVAVIAAKVDNAFGKYYSYVMPILKQMVAECTGADERILRGKAFECMSLLGAAVGKETFRNDAREAMQAIMQLQATNQLDDKEGTFKEFVNESCQRISATLKEEFAQYLPGVLPILLNSVTNCSKFKLIEDIDSAEASEESDEELQIIEDGGSYRGIKTSQVQELLSTLETITAFVQSIGVAYRPFVQQTAMTLLPLLDFEFDEDVRGETLSAWSEMVGLCEGNVARELIITANQKLSKAMAEEQYDMWALEAQTRGLSDVLKKAPLDNLLQPNEVHEILQLAIKLMSESVQRRQTSEQAEEEEEEDEDDAEAAVDEENQNENVRIAICELIGSLMEKHKSSFVACNGPSIASSLIQKFFDAQAKPEDKSLALYIACDCLEFLSVESVPMWPVFMDALLNSVIDTDERIRQAACFGVNVAAKIPNFSAYAIVAAQRLASVLRAGNAKSKKNLLATDNAAAALGWLIECQAPALAQGIQDVVTLWISHLPLNEDEQEGQSTHAQLLRLVKANNGLIQGDNQVKALKVFASIWKKENCDEPTTEGIVALFTALGKDTVSNIASKFAQKEKNQITRIFERAGL